MKKLIFTAALLIALALTSYGKATDKNTKLVKGLITASKAAQGSTTSNNGVYTTTSFNLNGSAIKAFYDVETEELIGFSIPMSLTDLPANSLNNMQKKFGSYTPQEAMMFINKDGYFGFYVSLTKPKKPTIVLDINTKGKVHYYGKMFL